MSLVTCPDCGSIFSNQEGHCPNCSFALPPDQIPHRRPGAAVIERTTHWLKRLTFRHGPTPRVPPLKR